MLALLLSGCSLLDRSSDSDNFGHALVECTNSYKYLESFAEKSETELLAEINAIDQALELTTSYCPKLKLAIFLSTPTSIIQSDTKSIRLYQHLLSTDQLSATDRAFIETQLKHISQRESLRQ